MARKKRRRNPRQSHYDLWSNQSILGGVISGEGAINGLVNYMKAPGDAILGIPRWGHLLIGVALGVTVLSKAFGSAAAKPTTVSGLSGMMFGCAPELMEEQKHQQQVSGIGSMMAGSPYYARQMYGMRSSNPWG